MTIRNSTRYSISAALQEAVSEYETTGLTVELKYCPKGSGRYISGTYYRVARGHENGRLIRIRINRHNHYPIDVQFKTSEYERRRNAKGQEMVYQRLRSLSFRSPEDLILAIFLHEFSHYLDHMEGRNGRYKQTKADKFAMDVLGKLGVL